MMSIRHDVISRLVSHRALTSKEITELDNLAIAVGLHDNDPMWGVIGWGWATLPRKTDFDVAVQAISDQKKEAPDLTATAKVEEGLKNLNGKLDGLIARPVHGALPAPEIDEVALRKALAAVMPAFVQKGGAMPQIDFVRQFKDAVQEGVSWVWVSLAGVLFAFALVLGYIAGEAMQGHDDSARIQALRGQVSTLTTVVAGQGKKEHREQ